MALLMHNVHAAHFHNMKVNGDHSWQTSFSHKTLERFLNILNIVDIQINIFCGVPQKKCCSGLEKLKSE